MSFFGKILQKLGIGSAAANTATTSPAGGTSQTASPSSASSSSAPTGATPTAMPMVDVVAQMEKRAAANPQKLNWRTSIVDLLKLLDLDSSFEARKELATELGCPPDLMGDSAKMNMWLHKTVLAKIAANGGNVPADLLH